MTLPKIHRYPGVKPFETSEKELFFGRKRDIQDLYDLISLEKLVVLFGKSGYGKSSLLNAGIVPKLSLENESEEGYEIIHIRLGAFSEEKKDDKGNAIQGRSFSPVEFVLHKLAQTGEMQADAAFLESITPEKTLWSAFKSHQKATESLRFVLLFDQFEEFFTYPLAEQIAFKQQLATLLYENIPQNIRDAAANLERKNRVWLSRAMDIKIVFAIRSDKMSALDSLKDYLPAILHKRYELKALTSEQAKEAIVQPASIKGEHFHSVPFEYTDAALTKIIAALTEANSDVKSQGVEAFQLQLLCEYLENKVIKNEVPDTNGNGLPDITPEQLPVMERLYEEYYHRKLKELPEPSRLAAQLVLEDGLLAEDAATGEGRRMSVDSNALLAQFRAKGLNNTILLALANTFLIRPETNTVGGVSYEISHDTLLAPIQKTKSERKAREEKEVLAAKAEAERKEKERAQKQLRTVQLLLGVAVLALIVAIGTVVYALRQKDIAVAATDKANQKTTEAEIAQEAAEKAKHESDSMLIQIQKQKGVILKGQQEVIDALVATNNQKKQTDDAMYKASISAGDAFLSQKKYNEAIAEYKKAIPYSSNSTEALNRIKQAESEGGIFTQYTSFMQNAEAISPKTMQEYENIYASYKKAIATGFKDGGVAKQKAGNIADIIVDLYLQKANTFYNAGGKTGYENALNYYQKAAVLHPSDNSLSNKIQDCQSKLK